MQVRTIWFERLLERLREAKESAELALPGLMGVDTSEIEREICSAELFIIGSDEAERLVENGEAPEDLKREFQLPFDTVFIQFDAPVELPTERGEGARGILVSVTSEFHYKVRVWFDERRATALPRYNFSFTPGETLPEGENRVVNLLYWLAGYVTAPNVLAIRHNLRPERKLALSGYYTFQSASGPKKRIIRRKPGEPKPRTTEVQGHFRRAHWHRLAVGKRLVWYPTTWVRAYKRRIPQPETGLEQAA
ncbi:MAG: hypothetical protein ABFD64_09750 [Armatimonadota bacterium]